MSFPKIILPALMSCALIFGLATLSACGKRGDPYASQTVTSKDPDAKPVKIDNSRNYPADYQDEPQKKKFLGLF